MQCVYAADVKSLCPNISGRRLNVNLEGRNLTVCRGHDWSQYKDFEAGRLFVDEAMQLTDDGNLQSLLGEVSCFLGVEQRLLEKKGALIKYV